MFRRAVNVTVCELPDDPQALREAWDRLVDHVKVRGSDLVLLPEMPFYPWIAATRPFDAARWQAAVDAHQAWQPRFAALAPARVLSSQPVNRDSRRLNEAFVWDAQHGCRAAHHKYYLPDEETYWESDWYQRGDGEFRPMACGDLQVGFLICTELWFMQHARAYGRLGVHLLATPRTTERATVERWLVGGRAAAIIAGAFALSSNRSSSAGQTPAFGGQGWIVAPDGRVLGLTSRQEPFLTVEIDPAEAERAKTTYPRYVPD